MKSLLIPFLLGLSTFAILQFVGFQTANAVENKNVMGGYEVLAANIVQIDGELFFISHPYQIQSMPNTTISFHNVNFTLPHDPSPPVPGGIRSTTIIFPDGVIEKLSKGVSGEIATIFSEHSKPTAGFSRHPDNNFYFLVSIDSEPPLKQFKSGVSALNVKCNDGLQLVIKEKTGKPACVRPESTFRLLLQGWILPHEINVKNIEVLLKYSINGGKITEISFEKESRSVIVLIQAVTDGYLSIFVPNKLTEAMYGKCIYDSFILEDSKEVFGKEQRSEHGKIIIIPFTNYTKTIEFPGTGIPECFS